MGKYRICVYAICKNEEKFVERWLRSMREADGIYVTDTGSSDKTVALLQKGGAIVQQKTVSPWRFDTARNLSMDAVPEDYDICVCTDLDEVFHPGWRSALEKAWQPGTLRARYRYTWNFNPDGSEGVVFFADKIHARKGFRWVNPVHEVLRYDGGAYQTVTVPGIQLDHHADNTKSRAQYLPLLELAVQEDPQNDRNTHYLGREYLFRGEYQKAIDMLLRHLSLPAATWADERCASMRYIAKSYDAMNNAAEAERWFLRAEAEAPHLREPWTDAALFYYRQKNWHAMLFCCEKALTIKNRPDTYITEAASWGALPYDLSAIGYYYTGDQKRAAEAIEQALVLAPQDARLQKNHQLILSGQTQNT